MAFKIKSWPLWSGSALARGLVLSGLLHAALLVVLAGTVLTVRPTPVAREAHLTISQPTQPRAQMTRWMDRLETLPPIPEPELELPGDPAWSRSVYHLYVIRVQDRDALQQRLTEAGIGTGLHYPLPLHLQAAYSSLGYSTGDFPVAEKAAKALLSLPMYPQLSSDQIGRVVDVVKEHFQGTSDAHSLVESKSS